MKGGLDLGPVEQRWSGGPPHQAGDTEARGEGIGGARAERGRGFHREVSQLILSPSPSGRQAWQANLGPRVVTAPVELRHQEVTPLCLIRAPTKVFVVR